MQLFKKGVGILLFVLGAVGLIFCLAAIYETGTGKTQLLAWTGQAFDSTGETLAKISERLDRVASVLKDTRAGLKSAVSRTDALQTDGTCDQARLVHISRILDEQVRKRLDQARVLVNSTAAGTGTIRLSLTLVDALNVGSEKAYKRGASLMTQIEGASATLTELSASLEQTLQRVQNLGDGSCSEQSLSKLTRDVDRMDRGLANVQALISDFKAAIQKIKDRLLLYGGKAVWWINLGSVMIPLMLLWLGVGQAFLMYFGWRIASAKRKL